jgi:hypothetical protein
MINIAYKNVSDIAKRRRKREKLGYKRTGRKLKSTIPQCKIYYLYGTGTKN